jgi:hypothetical protein
LQHPISKNLSQKIGVMEWLKVKVLSSSPSTTIKIIIKKKGPEQKIQQKS